MCVLLGRSVCVCARWESNILTILGATHGTVRVLRVVRCGYCKKKPKHQTHGKWKDEDGSWVGKSVDSWWKTGGNVQQLVGDNSLVLAVSIGLQHILCRSIHPRTLCIITAT